MTSSLFHSRLASKFRGCMVGTLIGDCLGAPFEEDPNDVEEFSEVSKQALTDFLINVLSSDSKKTYPYTDDTAMTVSLAKSLITNKKIDSLDVAKRFVTEFYRDPQRGYGYHVTTVFRALKNSNFQDVFLPAKLQFNGSGSYGNGAAMRIAPLALFTYNENDDLIQNAAKECSLMTHAHRDGYNGAILQCFAVQAALKLDSSQELNPVEFINQLETKMKKIESKEDAPYCDSLKKMREIYLEAQNDITSEKIAKCLGNDISALRSVPSAIYSFLRGLQPLPEFESLNPFIRSLYFAISLGGDTDTIASMACSIAGAYHGDQIIPEVMQKKCELIDEIIVLAGDLYNASQ